MISPRCDSEMCFHGGLEAGSEISKSVWLDVGKLWPKGHKLLTLKEDILRDKVNII